MSNLYEQVVDTGNIHILQHKEQDSKVIAQGILDYLATCHVITERRLGAYIFAAHVLRSEQYVNGQHFLVAMHAQPHQTYSNPPQLGESGSGLFVHLIYLLLEYNLEIPSVQNDKNSLPVGGKIYRSIQYATRADLKHLALGYLGALSSIKPLFLDTTMRVLLAAGNVGVYTRNKHRLSKVRRMTFELEFERWDLLEQYKSSKFLSLFRQRVEKVVTKQEYWDLVKDNYTNLLKHYLDRCESGHKFSQEDVKWLAERFELKELSMLNKRSPLFVRVSNLDQHSQQHLLGYTPFERVTPETILDKLGELDKDVSSYQQAHAQRIKNMLNTRYPNVKLVNETDTVTESIYDYNWHDLIPYQCEDKLFVFTIMEGKFLLESGTNPYTGEKLPFALLNYVEYLVNSHPFEPEQRGTITQTVEKLSEVPKTEKNTNIRSVHWSMEAPDPHALISFIMGRMLQHNSYYDNQGNQVYLPGQAEEMDGMEEMDGTNSILHDPSQAMDNFGEVLDPSVMEEVD